MTTNKHSSYDAYVIYNMLRYATRNEVVLQLSRGALSHTILAGGPNLDLLSILMAADSTVCSFSDWSNNYFGTGYSTLI